jgi:hypothetical protein
MCASSLTFEAASMMNSQTVASRSAKCVAFSAQAPRTSVHALQRSRSDTFCCAASFDQLATLAAVAPVRAARPASSRPAAFAAAAAVAAAASMAASSAAATDAQVSRVRAYDAAAAAPAQANLKGASRLASKPSRLSAATF